MITYLYVMITKELVEKYLKESNSITDLISRKLKLSHNTVNVNKVREIIKENKWDTSHFNTLIKRKPWERKYEIITKKCLSCDNYIETKLGWKKEKKFCSKSCSNKYRKHSEETKTKISEKSFKNHRINFIKDKYGPGIIDKFRSFKADGNTKDVVITNLKITKDDCDLLWKIFDNDGKNLLNIDDLINKYEEFKNLRKVALFFKVSYEYVNARIPHEIKLRINKGKNLSNSKRVTSWKRKIKIKLVSYKGGKCEKCGYNKCIAALHFHHLDPKKKEFTISGKAYSFERMKKEVDKCILVCSNCHHEIHEEERETFT